MPSRDDLRQLYNIGGQGTLAVNLTPKIEDACEELGISYSLLRRSPADFNRTVLTHARRGRNRATDIGLRPEEAQESGGYLADLSRARDRRTSRHLADIRMNASQVDAARALGLTSPLDLWIYSQTGGHKEAGEERLKDLNERQPNGIRLGITVVPHEKYLRDALVLDPEFPLRLKRKRLLDCTLEIDNRSRIVARYGRNFQDQLVCKGVASLLAGQLQFANQRGPADCAHALGRYGSLVGVRFGLRYWLPAPALRWFRPFAALLGSADVGHGKIDDLIEQTIGAASDALNEKKWRALDEDVDRKKQAFMTLTCPLPLTDPRWFPLVAEVEHWFDSNHNFITPIWASGPGTPQPELAEHRRYWIQASLFYPVGDIPKAVRKIVELQKPVRTEDDARGNGSVNADEKQRLVRAVS